MAITSSDEQIQDLQRQLQEAEARADEYRRQREDVQATLEEYRRERERAEERALEDRCWREKAEKRAKEAEEKAEQKKRAWKMYLLDCLYIFQNHRIADGGLAAGLTTTVEDKHYPMQLRPWDEFTRTERDTHYNKIAETFGDKRVFPAKEVTRDKSYEANLNPAANEKDVDNFTNVALAAPVQRIFDMLIEFGFSKSKLRFTSTDKDLKKSLPASNHPKIVPDGLGIRESPRGSDTVFVYEIKAAHKFKVESLKRALEKENLFMEAIQRIHSRKTTTDAEITSQHNEDTQVAMALTQVFDYMINKEIAYGFVAAGKALVLLHVKQDDPKTLYYHNCVVNEEGIDNGTVDVSYTAVAQLASFCSLTLESKAPQRSTPQGLFEEAKSLLKKWPDPYPDAEEVLETPSSSQGTTAQPSSSGSEYNENSTEGNENGGEDNGNGSEDNGNKAKIESSSRDYKLRSRTITQTCNVSEVLRRPDDEDDDPPGAPTKTPMGGEKKRKERPSTGSSENVHKKQKERTSTSSSEDDHDISSDTDSPPTRQYCTQACLLGLKGGGDLDENCPNASSHCTVEGGSRHPINASEFTCLVGKGLCQNPYQDCVAVDPHGLSGKIGSIGTLFKLELAPYGYMFVGKGTQSAHLQNLQHESLIYSQLEGLQGKVVPVHLGIVDLAEPWGYLLPGGARVLHMMLMSWGGEVAADAGLPDLESELKRSLQTLSSGGIHHNEEHTSNILWNQERRRVMLVGLDRATILPAAKPKQLLRLVRKPKKPKKPKETKKTEKKRPQVKGVVDHKPSKPSLIQNELRLEE